MRIVLPFAAALPLAACAGASTDYPSLAIRDAELRRTGDVDYSNPAAPLRALPADQRALLEERRAAALANAAAFRESLGRAQRAVAAASGASVTSDAWAAAQVAVADLSSQRSAMAGPLADIELLYVETYDIGVDASDVERARNELAALQGEQDAAIAALRSRLRR
ncbi:hypothetical protein QQS45_00880 [Alteriqipengyuania flavescens]|uniref:hypothetical protein n=1 Tax=Alteriqipengyuania flavescens TaxID=3053610 RepID=UPI0025B54064|nr:hypothetical protein [Alteriqipengyuania flavescens]WJY18839.1 hypothetical protein QQW98_00880 [Alteriqipengyuania flavescens]WJY24779.1 hypothetical protein QQS45_00880 [Alteriqipengyuania flavescens]